MRSAQVGILASLVLLAPSPAGQTGARDEWLLVRGSADRVGSLTYERIARVYLAGAPCRIVRPAEAAGDVATSRLVIGTPTDNDLAARLAQALGITVAADRLVYAGWSCEPGDGLVILTQDPDGEGRLMLMTGVDAEGVFACFRAPISLTEMGWLLIRERIEQDGVRTGLYQVVANGTIPLRFDTSVPAIVRLDREAEYLIDEARHVRGDERFLRVARGFRGYEDVFASAGAGDPIAYARWLLGEGNRAIAAADAFFGDRDLDGEILDAYRRCAELKATVSGPRPAYHVLYGYPDGTNARTFEVDPVTGRPRVLFNLCALSTGRRFDAVVIHETVHTLQGAAGLTLLERAVHEGVATYLTQVVDPTLSDAEALLWSPEDLRAARDRRDAIVAAVRELADETDLAVQEPFMVPGSTPARIPGAPSRTAIFAGWLAVRAWREAHPESSPGDLLSTPAAELFATLGLR